MSLNNITPWWLIELDGIIARARVHRNAAQAIRELEENDYMMPKNVVEYWTKRFNDGEFDEPNRKGK